MINVEELSKLNACDGLYFNVNEIFEKFIRIERKFEVISCKRLATECQQMWCGIAKKIKNFMCRFIVFDFYSN